VQEGAEVAGALILKDREVKGDGVQHPCYLLSTGVTSSTGAGNSNGYVRAQGARRHVTQSHADEARVTCTRVTCVRITCRQRHAKNGESGIYVARQEATPHSKVRTGRFHYMFEIGLFFVFFSLGVRGLGLGVLKVRIGLGRPVQPFGLGSQFMR